MSDNVVPFEGDQLLGWQVFGTTNVPEPTTAALLALGVFGAAYARRRRAH